jgi:hypothetical protein
MSSVLSAGSAPDLGETSQRSHATTLFSPFLSHSLCDDCSWLLGMPGPGLMDGSRNGVCPSGAD